MEAWALKYSVWIIFPTVFLLAFALALILVRVIRVLALKHHWFDVPNARSMHVKPIPRLGGVGIVLAFFITMGVCVMLREVLPDVGWLLRVPPIQLLIGGGLLAAVGLWDDLRGMRATTKLFFQVVAAVVAVLGGLRFALPFIPVESMGMFGQLISICVTIAWIVLMINAVNLIDGLDGLAAGVSIIAIFSITAAFAFKGYGPDFVFVAIFVGSILGFLAHNKHPAAIFMGDCGSLFLGYMLATFALPNTGGKFMGLTFLVPVVALGLPLMDTSLAVVRRAAERKGIFSADKDHIHHRVATRMGLSHQHTVLSLYALSLCFGGISILISISGNAPLVALTLSLLGIMIFAVLLKLGYIKPLAPHLEERGELKRVQRVSSDSKSLVL